MSEFDRMTAYRVDNESAQAVELEMSIGYVLDNEPPKTLAGCYERIRNMQEIIRAIAPLKMASMHLKASVNDIEQNFPSAESMYAQSDLMQNDIAALLIALGMFAGARPESPHVVMQQAIAKVVVLRKALALCEQEADSLYGKSAR